MTPKTTQRPIRRLVPVLALLIACASAQTPVEEPARSVDYLRDVLPILAERCYACHGPDAEARQGDVRLDRREDAVLDPGWGAPIAPGRPDESLVIQRVITADETDRMPPAGDGDRMPESEVATLRAWIAQGAEWGTHWAFAPPLRPVVPPLTETALARDPIDAFVRARLADTGLEPSPEIGRAAWLRRVTFDLTGVGPSPEELDDFLADTREDAYELVVDRLLASPRHGERQAQEWLDLARYADTNGYQRDAERQAWKWREWVVNAFNSNMPFDRFTIEQLAGDLLPEPTLDQLIATGFNRNHPVNTEAGEEVDEYRSAYVIDRVNTTATTWMGLTVACAQCHDHKYDPLPQKDYYRFFAFFNQIDERDSDGFGRRNPRPSIPVPDPDQAPRLADLKGRIDALETRLDAEDPLADAGQRAWETKTLASLDRPIAWTTAEPIGMLAENGSILRRLDDGSILSSGDAPVRDTYEIVLKPGARKVTALRLEVLPDESQPDGATGRGRNGRFILTALRIRVSTLADSQAPPLLYLARADADVNQEPPEDPKPDEMYPGSVESAVVVADDEGGDGRGFGRGWSIVGDERLRGHEAILLPLETLRLNDASIVRVSLEHTARPYKSLIGRFRISFTEDEAVRDLLLPTVAGLWSSIGPFPAADEAKSFATAFELEKGLEAGVDLKKKYEAPELPKPAPKGKPGDGAEGKPGDPPAAKAEAKETGAAPAAAKEPRKEAARAPMAVADRGAKTEEATKIGDGDKGKPGADAESDPAAATAKEKPKEKDADGEAKPEAKERPKPQLAWKEQRGWRDGRRLRLEGSGGAVYLTRKVTSRRARTALLSLDGGAAVRVWINGSEVFTDPPKPPTKPAAAEEDEAPAFFFRRDATSERKVRIGLREGENELVVKVVLPAPAPEGRRGGSSRRSRGGTSFTFDLTAEGDDVLDHEVVKALRAEARDRIVIEAAVPPEAAPAGPTSGPSVGAVTRDDDEKETPGPTAESEREARHRIIRRYYRRRIDSIGRLLHEEKDRLEREKRELEAKIPQALVMKELKEPRDTHVYIRGHYENKGDKVTAGVPAVLPRLSADQPRNRLGLARWLVSRDHPLTARVTVNRIWQQYFGRGLVGTPEDFGLRGDRPSHPALLDWLAVELMEGGWDLKKLHRRIVLSATYRQTDRVGPEQRDTDPENVWLARGPRERLSAEMIRDQALAVSGLLVEKIGGPSVKPYQPPGLWKAVTGGRDYQRDEDESQYRRGLYVYWKRGVPYPSMLIFDASKRETCTVRRPRTTTPLQALVLLNDPAYVETARRLGDRMRRAKGDADADRLAFGFRLCTSRLPTEAEQALLQKLLTEQRAHYEADVEAAKKLLEVGDAPRDEEAKPAEAAAWASVATALLNLDATLHRG